jgi:hypothetical protein
MENGEEPNNDTSNPEWGLGLKSDEKAQHNSRGGDTRFNGWNWHTQNAECPSEGHNERKNDRQKPYGRRTKEGTPQADRHHCDDVVPSKNGMGKAAEKTGTDGVAPCVR